MSIPLKRRKWVLKNNFVQRKFCGSKIIKLKYEGLGGKYKNLNLNWKKYWESGVRMSFESSKSQRRHLELCLE